MSILNDIFANPGPQPEQSPLLAAANRARTSLEEATRHLMDALTLISAEYNRAAQEVSLHQQSLTDAQARVDQFRQAAIHLAAVGQGVENLLAAGQAQPGVEIPAVVEEIQNVIANAEEVVAHAEAAVAPAGQPASNV